MSYEEFVLQIWNYCLYDENTRAILFTTKIIYLNDLETTFSSQSIQGQFTVVKYFKKFYDLL